MPAIAEMLDKTTELLTRITRSERKAVSRKDMDQGVTGDHLSFIPLTYAGPCRISRLIGTARSTMRSSDATVAGKSVA